MKKAPSVGCTAGQEWQARNKGLDQVAWLLGVAPLVGDSNRDQQLVPGGVSGSGLRSRWLHGMAGHGVIRALSPVLASVAGWMGAWMRAGVARGS